MLLQEGQLIRLVTGLKKARESELIVALTPALSEFEITTSARVCACLAQFAHETVGFKFLRELGNEEYLSKYDFRADLGNNAPGMGARYRGRGFIQLTGLFNYQKAEAALDLALVKNPELLEQLDVAARVSCWWWKSHGLNELADGDGVAAFKKITKVINGGYNGLNSRINYWTTAKTIWK